MIILEFIFKSFWHFLGVLILVGALGQFLITCWIRFLRYWVLIKHGYPPQHCDADGDFKTPND